MLHILFIILKIAGIILAVILGILLLLVCIVLFVPICYKAEAECGGTLEDIRAHGQISWLFGLARAAVDFRNKSPDFSIKLAWKTLGGRSESIQEEEADYEEYKEHEEDGEEHERALGQKDSMGQAPDSKEPEKPEKISQKDSEADEGYGECKSISEEKSGIPEETGADAEEVCEEEPEKGREPVAGKRRKKLSPFRKIKEKLQGFISKISQMKDKFKCTIQKLCDKIEEALKKKDKLAAFIIEETHVNALLKGKKELIRLLGHLPPKAVWADIHYGFEDPYLTGRVLAVFGVFYPFYGDHVRITPDFEEKILEGSLYIKGRIYVMHLAALAVRMLLDRNVRRTIKDVRKFQL